MSQSSVNFRAVVLADIVMNEALEFLRELRDERDVALSRCQMTKSNQYSKAHTANVVRYTMLNRRVIAFESVVTELEQGAKVARAQLLKSLDE